MAFRRWQTIAGVVLLVAAAAASAMSLGRVRGTALVGRSLDLSVQAGMEANEATPESNCFAADVFYGDSRVSPNAVSISPERTSNGELRIRVRASPAVDEPVVTLFIRVSCGSAVSRRYVLLAEALSDAEPSTAQPLSITPAITPSAPRPAPLASPRIAFGGAAASESSAAAPDGNAAGRRAERAAQRQAAKEARNERRQRQAQDKDNVPPKAVSLAGMERAPSASIMRKAGKENAPRLQVDLLDFTSANLSLRGSAEMASAPTNDEAVRRQAQALWRTLNASPEETLRDAQRLEALEAQIRSAQDLSKRQGQDLTSLSAQLAAEQKARYLNPLTIGLGLLALAALALSLILWRSSKGLGSGKPWWGGTAAKEQPQDERHLWKHLGDGSESIVQPLSKQTSSNSPSGFSSDATSPGMPARSSGISNEPFKRPNVLAAKGQGSLRNAETFEEPLDVKSASQKSSAPTPKIAASSASALAGRNGSMSPADGSLPASLMKPESSSRNGRNSGFGNTDFGSASLSGGGRVVAAEELFDIQEQADFFLSLGQPEQAIEVLKNHITENVETSALAYMDLFDIYHKTNREADYAELRDEFNNVFNAQVPEFAKYGGASNGLEDVPDMLRSIQDVWSKPQQAQDVIEESIFRQPGQDQRPLDMLAYRELMLLYALAKELGRPGAKFSLLPASMQSAALPNLSGGTSVPDFDVSQSFEPSGPQDDMLSFAAKNDLTVSLPSGLLPPGAVASSDDSLDFDLSDSAPLNEYKLPNTGKKKS